MGLSSSLYIKASFLSGINLGSCLTGETVGGKWFYLKLERKQNNLWENKLCFNSCSSVEDYLLTENTQNQQKYKSIALKRNLTTMHFSFLYLFAHFSKHLLIKQLSLSTEGQNLSQFWKSKWSKSHGFLLAALEQEKVSVSHPASNVLPETGNPTNKTVWSISVFLIYFARALTLITYTTVPHN